VRTGLFPWG